MHINAWNFETFNTNFIFTYLLKKKIKERKSILAQLNPKVRYTILNQHFLNFFTVIEHTDKKHIWAASIPQLMLWKHWQQASRTEAHLPWNLMIFECFFVIPQFFFNFSYQLCFIEVAIFCLVVLLWIFPKHEKNKGHLFSRICVSFWKCM